MFLVERTVKSISSRPKTVAELTTACRRCFVITQLASPTRLTQTQTHHTHANKQKKLIRWFSFSRVAATLPKFTRHLRVHLLRLGTVQHTFAHHLRPRHRGECEEGYEAEKDVALLCQIKVVKSGLPAELLLLSWRGDHDFEAFLWLTENGCWHVRQETNKKK